MAERFGNSASSPGARRPGSTDRVITGLGRFGQSLMAAMARFALWFGDSLIHALGNPEEERRLQPPLVGVQPYCDRPYRYRMAR